MSCTCTNSERWRTCVLPVSRLQPYGHRCLASRHAEPTTPSSRGPPVRGTRRSAIACSRGCGSSSRSPKPRREEIRVLFDERHRPPIRGETRLRLCRAAWICRPSASFPKEMRRDTVRPAGRAGHPLLRSVVGTRGPPVLLRPLRRQDTMCPGTAADGGAGPWRSRQRTRAGAANWDLARRSCGSRDTCRADASRWRLPRPICLRAARLW